MARGRRQPAVGLRPHAERGSQYACAAYQQLLPASGSRWSMRETGEGLGNAVAERFCGRLQGERTALRPYVTRQEVREDVVESIEMCYNSTRFHAYVGYVSPNDDARWATVASLCVCFYLTRTGPALGARGGLAPAPRGRSEQPRPQTSACARANASWPPAQSQPARTASGTPPRAWPGGALPEGRQRWCLQGPWGSLLWPRGGLLLHQRVCICTRGFLYRSRASRPSTCTGSIGHDRCLSRGHRRSPGSAASVGSAEASACGPCPASYL
jgi:putative transposase